MNDRADIQGHKNILRNDEGMLKETSVCKKNRIDPNKQTNKQSAK